LSLVQQLTKVQCALLAGLQLALLLAGLLVIVWELLLLHL
jgi:hypothetical protein